MFQESQPFKNCMIMTRYEIEQGLNALYRDLDNAQNMDEETARRVTM